MSKFCSVLTVTNRDSYLKNIFYNFYSQDHRNKELIVVLNNNNLSIDEYEQNIREGSNVKIIKCDESMTLGECKNVGIKECKFNYVAFFDDDDYYGPRFISDSLHVFDKRRCDIVGKKCFYVYFEESKNLSLCLGSSENKYVYHVADSSMILKRRVVENLTFPSIHGPGTITTYQSNCISKGYRIYSTNRHHYVAHRHANPNKTHTWSISEKDLKKHCRSVAKNVNDYTTIVNV